MSLHASLSPEARAALNSQQKASTIFSFIIAILAMALIALILLVISLTIESKSTSGMVSYQLPPSAPDSPLEKPTETEITNKPISSVPSAANVILPLISAPITIEAPTTITSELAYNMGEDMVFEDWPEDVASASAKDFGDTIRKSGTIGGYFYDFKQDRGRTPVKNYSNDKHGNFVRRVKRFHRSRYSSKSLANHYKGDQQLFIKYVAIPFGSADAGPRHFGLESQVKPSGWMVHYKGKVIAPRDGRFRFVGIGDDYLSVGVNSRPHLMAPWHNMRADIVTRRTNSDLDIKRPGPFGANIEERLRNSLLLGRWFTVRKGEQIDIDIAFGESPGGKMGYILMIEEKGVQYKKQANGSPILPPFTVGELHENDIRKLKAFPNWKFELDNVPVFSAPN